MEGNLHNSSGTDPFLPRLVDVVHAVMDLEVIHRLLQNLLVGISTLNVGAPRYHAITDELEHSVLSSASEYRMNIKALALSGLDGRT